LKLSLPTVEGVGPSCLGLPDGEWKNIMEFLEEWFPDIKPSTWTSRMSRGEVVDGQGARLGAGSPYRRGTLIFYYRELEGETPIPFVEDILYQDDHILVADKPHFLPVVPAGRFLHETLLVRLKKKLKLEHLVPIHRIDREAAGVVIFSHNPATRGNYVSLFRKREVKKDYEALARTLQVQDGRFPVTRCSRIVEGEHFFCMKEVAGVPNSETCIDVLKNMGNATLYRLTPVTGKKHQLRVHLAALGIPIINDRLYPDVQPCEADNVDFPLKLIARAISFQDPLTGQDRYFESSREI